MLLVVLLSLIAIAGIAVTVIGAARAWRNQHTGWVIVIIGAWVVGLGWAAALFYLVGVDARTNISTGPPPGPLP